MVVEKANKIFITTDQLTVAEVKVQWQQNLRANEVQYYAVSFFNRDQDNEESVIFIQKSYLDSLKNKKDPGDDLTAIVDDSFQYGQNKEKTKRCLAYHDKKNEAYQWRFVEGLKSKLGNAALKFAGGFFPSIDLGMLKLLFGDYLRNF